ncbi:anti-sigma factor family protein [Streptomyces sp. KMM 9044]|uniref:anti-sigma factor family protein n=1 Tax=Streptomyces sp. KMM 9044 TaxID=2744474 RepID=UPI002150B863|nr:zf-HC2 domain-containing protein [Streptomyces sp. KMM 9044]WAX79108.1 zf-HC2 domain-containing protein [Streptomyces sp. KMM 9044]
MTSTTDMTEHPGVEEISDLAEGLLSPARDTAVRRHLDECEICADVRASLAEIRGLLGTMPSPPRMPAETASRIDAALAAEARLHATVTEPQIITEPVGAEPVDTSPALSDEDRAHVSRETSVPRETAAAADRPTGHPRPSSTGPGRKGRMHRGRRRAAVLGTVFTVAALGLGTVFLSSENEDSGDSRQTAAADTFSEGKLEERVSALLAQGQMQTAPSNSLQTFGLESAPGSATSPRVLRSVVPECIRKGIGHDDAALATEEGTYKGREALLVVLADPSDDTRVTAYIVDTACVSRPASASAARILLKHSYTRA